MTKYSSPYEQLYLERCQLVEGVAKPSFWQPQPVPPISKKSFCLYGDENLIVKEEWNCDRVINKLIALGLELELEVGEFVRESQKSDLPQDPYLKKLLQSNIADEAKHFKGFDYIRKGYDLEEDNLKEAAKIRKIWQSLAEVYHPLFVAMALEIAVFLPFLGCSRLFGGKEIATVARRIAEDEYRHVITNRTVLDEMNLNPWQLPAAIASARDETIAWAIGDLYIPEDSPTDEELNLDFILQASNDLLETGVSEELDDLCYCADHVLPFEVSNASQYDRAVELI